MTTESSQSVLSFPASEALNLDSNERGSLKQDGSSKITSMPKQSSESIGKESLSIQTLLQSTGAHAKGSMFSQEDSPVKIFRLQEKRRESKKEQEADYGLSSLKRLGYYDQDTSSLRTYQKLLTTDSQQFLQILPKSGMMRSGMIYELPILAHGTKENGFSSLPTPTVMDSISTEKMEGKFTKTKNGTYRQWNPKGYNRPLNLSRMASWRMFPTPNANMYRDTGKAEKLIAQKGKHMITTAKTVAEMSPLEWNRDGGQLNPTWVEWLMGFPLGWTELDVSETQSFRKSRSSSAKLSKKKKVLHEI